jgi:hypothetical protein
MAVGLIGYIIYSRYINSTFQTDEYTTSTIDGHFPFIRACKNCMIYEFLIKIL